MRAHPMVGDSLLAVLLALLDLLVFAINAAAPFPKVHPWYVTVPMDLVMVLPLVFRRRAPVLTAYAVLAVSIPHSVLQLGVGSLFASAIALYTLVVYVGRKQAAWYLAAQLVSTGAQTALMWRTQTVSALILFTVTFAFCWLLGEFVGARRAYHTEVEARLHLLETERDQASRIAVAEERGRIARELHDVVAHAVSVIVVQADGASYAVRKDPDLAERAVHTISATGREALGELRRLLDVLRNEDGIDVPRTPQPDAQSLADLANRVSEAGVPVRLQVEGNLAGLPTGVSLGIYRIVQESLTNTLKHAGPGARAHVRIERREDVIEVTVTDDGAGRARALVPADGPLPGGNGVIGMRERAHVYGGSLDVGPLPGGGWRVRASLPVGSAP
ncbi:two-component sensor histidine kinase [Amycolatopsis bartoniae]|uniref:histidine kinase n=2 Tax=Amycolatopsis bartoniae TaxID=941986 RepID=A0A8H9ISG0_9PSEU|nr:two-component sensor histidine kinase [Amycolatopsis bartoniae]